MKKIILFLLLPLSSSAQWTNDASLNTSVCKANGNQEEVRIISDGSDGAIITWMDSRPAGNTDIFTQRLNSSGIPVWTSDGIAVCSDAFDQTVPAIVEDGNGGAIIVWKDIRDGNSDIYAQRINSSGLVQWTANGVAVDTKTGGQIDPKVVNDGSGGAIITWQDSTSGNWDIYAQRIDASGNKLWSAGGVVVCSAANDQKNPKIIVLPGAESIITWQDKRNGNNYDIYAQKINASGVVQWAVNGLPVCTSADTQNNPKIESDGSDGAIIAWADKRNGSDYNIFAQRLNGAGVPQWTANGIAICQDLGNQSAIDIATNQLNGAIITWKDYRNNIYADIYAQYINLSGTVQWATNGIPISIKSFDQINPNIVSDASGAIIVWQDLSGGSWDVYAQKVLTSGAVQWGTNGKNIGSASSSQTGPKQIISSDGSAVVAWQDYRDSATSKLDVYAQKINPDGSLGVGINEKIINPEKVQVRPNPGNGLFHLILPQTDHYGELEIFNLLGEKVYSASLKMDKEKSLEITLESSGIYFYKLSQAGKKADTGKIIVR